MASSRVQTHDGYVEPTGDEASGDVLALDDNLKPGWEKPSGGSQPVKQERFVELTAATGGPLNWAHNFGDALLDYSDPAAPTVIEAGTYALSIFIRIGGTEITGGTYLHIDAEMDSDNDDWDIHNNAPVVPDSTLTEVGCAITAKIPAGAVLRATSASDVTGTNLHTSLFGQIAKIA